jgi:anti-sigma factor RsiW
MTVVAEMSRQELVEVITDYLVGALPAADRERFDAHLTGCDGCTTYLEQMRATIATVGRLRADELAPDARARLLSLFRDWRGC